MKLKKNDFNDLKSGRQWEEKVFVKEKMIAKAETFIV